MPTGRSGAPQSGTETRSLASIAVEHPCLVDCHVSNTLMELIDYVYC